MAIPFFLFLLGTMEVSYDLYAQEALDYAAFQAARLVSVGSVMGPLSNSAFVQQAVCPTLSGLLGCGYVTAQLNCVTSGTFYSAQQEAPPSGSGTTINTGLPSQFMYLQLWYAGPTFLGQLIPGYANGSFVHFTFSSAGFVNEQFLGGQQC
jgi:hypothetical protein